MGSITAESTALLICEIGSFHIGGRMVRLKGLPPRARSSTRGGPVRPIDPNGEIMVGQMYVQYVNLAAPLSPIPLLMWHGGGMTGANWETTPDGRPGWQMFFLRAGFNTYVSDAVVIGDACNSINFFQGRIPVRGRILEFRFHDVHGRHVILQLRRGIEGHEHSMVHDRDPVAQLVGLVHVMRRQQNG